MGWMTRTLTSLIVAAPGPCVVYLYYPPGGHANRAPSGTSVAMICLSNHESPGLGRGRSPTRLSDGDRRGASRPDGAPLGSSALPDRHAGGPPRLRHLVAGSRGPAPD